VGRFELHVGGFVQPLGAVLHLSRGPFSTSHGLFFNFGPFWSFPLTSSIGASCLTQFANMNGFIGERITGS